MLLRAASNCKFRACNCASRSRNTAVRWVRGDSQPSDLAATVLQYQQSIEQSEGDGRNHEQVHRRDAVSMIMQERPPTLGWRPPTPCHMATVVCPTSMPSLRSSPWPHSSSAAATAAAPAPPQRSLPSIKSKRNRPAPRSKARAGFGPPLGSASRARIAHKDGQRAPQHSAPITIDGKTYEHDVVIRLSGEVMKRKKKLYRPSAKRSAGIGSIGGAPSTPGKRRTTPRTDGEARP